MTRENFWLDLVFLAFEELFFFLQKWKIKNPTLRIVRISAKRVLWEKNCSCFDSVLVILTSRDLVHTFELSSREFQSHDYEFKSDQNILSKLLKLIVTNKIRKNVCLSILRFTIQRKETTLLGDSRSWSVLKDLTDYHRC